ncbi:MAG: hypothetical protein Q7R88_02805 [bacterium]|nr:hypothetical protein [bacterium]
MEYSDLLAAQFPMRFVNTVLVWECRAPFILQFVPEYPSETVPLSPQCMIALRRYLVSNGVIRLTFQGRFWIRTDSISFSVLIAAMEYVFDGQGRDIWCRRHVRLRRRH